MQLSGASGRSKSATSPQMTSFPDGWPGCGAGGGAAGCAGAWPRAGAGACCGPARIEAVVSARNARAADETGAKSLFMHVTIADSGIRLQLGSWVRLKPVQSTLVGDAKRGRNRDVRDPQVGAWPGNPPRTFRLRPS